MPMTGNKFRRKSFRSSNLAPRCHRQLKTTPISSPLCAAVLSAAAAVQILGYLAPTLSQLHVTQQSIRSSFIVFHLEYYTLVSRRSEALKEVVEGKRMRKVSEHGRASAYRLGS